VLLRVTGILRTPTGLEHVREAPGALVRFIRPRPEPVEPPVAQPIETDPSAVSTTLIVERAGQPQGVELGLGHLERLSSGTVMTTRTPRPAVRVVAGTGPLLLSFDTEAERDRAAAELIDETGLGPDGKHVLAP
jgi:hypothetical protein